MKVSSIVKKMAMAATGLALVTFLIAHLSGNLQLYAGSAKFDAYAKMLEEMPGLLIPAEIGLLVLFCTHIYLALKLTSENKTARPQEYLVKQKSTGESTLASRTMLITGFVILAFVIWHIWMFKFGDKTPHSGSLYRLVRHEFSKWYVVAGYAAAMILMGLHLSHAISSAFQSLGLLNLPWRARARKLGNVVGWLIAIGFALLPVWSFFAEPPPPSLNPAAAIKSLLNDK